LPVDELAALERQGREERKAAKTKTPEQKAARNRGRAQRNRGYRSENRAQKILKRFGFQRVPFSGRIDGWDGDLERRVRDGRVLVTGENKHRKADWVTLRKWLTSEKNIDFLRLDAGAAKDALWVIPESKMLMLLEEAGYDA
jgi:hypothetical protein